MTLQPLIGVNARLHHPTEWIGQLRPAEPIVETHNQGRGFVVFIAAVVAVQPATNSTIRSHQRRLVKPRRQPLFVQLNWQ